MSDKLIKPAVLALGYFDSVHLGHQKVIRTAKKLAQENSAILVVVTFKGNLKAALGNGDDKVVYTAEERAEIYRAFGADDVFFAPVSEEFLSMSGEEFLSLIDEKYNVIGYVSGYDYRFGKNGSSGKNEIKKHAEINSRFYKVVELLKDEKEKISTTWIKKLLKDGLIEKANTLLGRSYSVEGEVFPDRQIGKTLGFPTVNVRLNKDKYRLRDGVYKGHVELCEKTYDTIINYGARPTFSLDEKLVEAHIVDFSGNLYGQKITLYFDCFMRDVEKFEKVELLIEQLKKDLLFVRTGKYD